MIPKIIAPHSYDFGTPEVAIMRFSREGLDRDHFKKVAKEAGGMMFEKELRALKPMKGKTVIHTIAVGDEEKFGDNRNGDGFNTADNKRCHHRFKTHGHVFKNHDNDDPDKATGEILYTGHNDPMSRIEIIAALDNEKNAEEVQGLEEGKDLAVSMGSLVEKDVCSHCGHGAPTSQEHCDCIRNHLGEITKDGQKIYMKNPDPWYMDLSTVWKPADRCGYTLRKVAVENGNLPGYELAIKAGMSKLSAVKTAVLLRLATMEKRVPGLATLAEVPPGTPEDLPKAALKNLKSAAAAHGVPAILGFLHKRGCVLGLPDFCAVVFGDSPTLDPVTIASAQKSPRTFHGLLKAGYEVTSLDGIETSTPIRFDNETLETLDRATSMKTAFVGPRIIRSSLSGRPLVKAAGDLGVPRDPFVVRGLSDLYAHYKVAFAGNPWNSSSSSTLGALVRATTL